MRAHADLGRPRRRPPERPGVPAAPRPGAHWLLSGRCRLFLPGGGRSGSGLPPDMQRRRLAVHAACVPERLPAPADRGLARALVCNPLRETRRPPAPWAASVLGRPGHQSLVTWKRRVQARGVFQISPKLSLPPAPRRSCPGPRSQPTAESRARGRPPGSPAGAFAEVARSGAPDALHVPAFWWLVSQASV